MYFAATCPAFSVFPDSGFIVFKKKNFGLRYRLESSTTYYYVRLTRIPPSGLAKILFLNTIAGMTTLPEYVLTWSSVLAKRTNKIKVEGLGRFLLFVLGHKPDEFGLTPDKDGFVKYKELLQAIHEEPGWSYVRQSHINEVLLGRDRGLFQAEDNRIRSLERRWRLDLETPSQYLPKILFTAIRTKAHPVVMDKGLIPGEGRYVVLSSNEELSLRIGRRRDQKPVLLTILADTAAQKGVLFHPFGSLFLSPLIPAEFISGPPVRKDVLERRGDRDKQKEKPMPRELDFHPGTFPLDITGGAVSQKKVKGKKRKGWKEAARKAGRNKYR